MSFHFNYPNQEYGVCYFCLIKKPSLRRKTNYFDCASCKILKVDLPDIANCPDIQATASHSQSSEGDNDTDFVYEESNSNRFKWSVASFKNFCRELNLSKLMSKKCLAML